MKADTTRPTRNALRPAEWRRRARLHNLLTARPELTDVEFARVLDEATRWSA